jgi:hypothetical protein
VFQLIGVSNQVGKSQSEEGVGRLVSTWFIPPKVLTPKLSQLGWLYQSVTPYWCYTLLVLHFIGVTPYWCKAKGGK